MIRAARLTGPRRPRVGGAQPRPRRPRGPGRPVRRGGSWGRAVIVRDCANRLRRHTRPRPGPPRPRQTTGEGVRAEAQRRHRGDSGGQGDESTDAGQQTRPEHRHRAATHEPVLGAIDLLGTQQHVATPAVQRRPPAVPADQPGQIAARDVTGGTRDDHRDQIRMRTADRTGRQRSAEHHGHLGRNRKTGRLRGHQHEDRDQPVGQNQLLHNASRRRARTSDGAGSGIRRQGTDLVGITPPQWPNAAESTLRSPWAKVCDFAAFFSGATGPHST